MVVLFHQKIVQGITLLSYQEVNNCVYNKVSYDGYLYLLVIKTPNIWKKVNAPHAMGNI